MHRGEGQGFAAARVGGWRHRAAVLGGCTVGLVAAMATIQALCTLGGLGHTAGALQPPSRADDVLLTLVAWAGVGLAGWLASGSMLGLLSVLPGATGQLAAQAADRLSPAILRKVLTLVLGASIGSLALPAAGAAAASGPSAGRASLANAVSSDAEPAAGAAASLPRAEGGSALPGDPAALQSWTSSDAPKPGFQPSVRAPRTAQAERLLADDVATSQHDPGFRPTRPVPVLSAERARLLAPAPRASSATHDLVTVRRGDTLWSIARRHLGAEATDVQVAHEWPRWHAANRAVVGDDPDRILPGQQLRPPDPWADLGSGSGVSR